MRTILYGSVSANGLVLLGDEANHQIPNEVMADFMQKIMEARNVVIGRKTFDLLLKTPAARAGFKDIELVVLSQTMERSSEYTVVGSARAALNHLQANGFSTALVAGGGQAYSSFIEEGLADEIYLNINPLISGKGGALFRSVNTHLPMRLTGTRQLTDQVVQLAYKVK